MNIICRMKCGKCGWESGEFNPAMGRPEHSCDIEAAKRFFSPLQSQVGGDHYRKLAIQPVEFIHANKLNFLEGCIVKRICRHRDKNGRQDLEKIIHEVQLLIAIEYPEASK